MEIILWNEFNIDNFKFKEVRTSGVGAKIIDIDCNPIQTPWSQIIYDVDYAICTDVPEDLKTLLSQLDSKIVNHCADVLNFCPETMNQMYKPLLRTRENGYYFRMPISNSSVLWDAEKKHYNKKEMKEILKQDHYVRFIVKFKKLYFKDNNLTVQTELLQSEFR